MKSTNLIVLFVLLFLSNTLLVAQKQGSSELFRLPNDLGVILISSRSDSPIAIESPVLYSSLLANRLTCRYQLRNNSPKKIQRIRLQIITNFLFHPKGGGRLESYEEVFNFGENQATPFFEPRSTLWSRDNSFTLVPMLPENVTAEIKKQTSQLKSKFVVAIVVNRIDFEDGSKYDATSDAADLQRLFTFGVETR